MLTACDDLSSEDYIERAQNHREQGDIQASIIELKNAVQADRRNPEARLLLGRSYLDVGQLKNAEKEFLRARDLGIDRETAIETLAAVWLMLREPSRVLEEFENDANAPPDQRVLLHLVRATAHYDLGDLSSARGMAEPGQSP